MNLRPLSRVAYAIVVAVAVPLVVYAAASIPADCATPGDCDSITPRFETLTVKHTMSGQHLYVSGSGANPILMTNANGRVGIGTASPGGLLTAKGSIGKFSIDDQGPYPSMTRSNAALRFAGFNLGAIAFNGTADGYVTEQNGAVIRSLTEGDGSYSWQDAPAAGLAFDTTPNVSGGTLTERMRISAAGNVGIGTTSPGAKLDVYGDTPTVNTAQFGTVGIQSYATNIAMVQDNVYFDGSNTRYRQTGGGAFMQFGAFEPSAISFASIPAGVAGAIATPAYNMIIRFNGNVGIGTTSPQSTLHIPDGKYLQAEDNNAGAPPVGDCDADAERGRISIDTSSNRLYVCNGASRGWDYTALTD